VSKVRHLLCSRWDRWEATQGRHWLMSFTGSEVRKSHMQTALLAAAEVLLEQREYLRKPNTASPVHEMKLANGQEHTEGTSSRCRSPFATVQLKLGRVGHTR